MPKEPGLNNKSVRAQIRQSIVNKLSLFWPFRSHRLGFVLILFDPDTGECVTTTRGDPQYCIEATEKIAKTFRQGGPGLAEPAHLANGN